VDDDCPGGEADTCYVYDGDEGKYCVLFCETDDFCAAINPALVCRERSAVEPKKICVGATE